MTDGVITNTVKSQNIGIVREVGSSYQSGIYGMFKGASKDRNTQFFLTHQQDTTLTDGTKISFTNLTIKDLYASENVRNQFWLGYDKDRFSNNIDSLFLELGYINSDNSKDNYKSTIKPGVFSAIHYAD